jgi:hypothetical protein
MYSYYDHGLVPRVMVVLLDTGPLRYESCLVDSSVAITTSDIDDSTVLIVPDWVPF